MSDPDLPTSIEESVLLNEHERGRFKDFLEGLQVLSADGAVNRTVVTGEPDFHGLADDDLVILIDYGLFDRGPNTEDGSIVGVDYSVEVGDAEHTQIGDREGGTAHFVGREFFVAGFLDQGFGISADLVKILGLR